MRCPPQSIAEHIPHSQPQQLQGLPSSYWPPCPPQHAVDNPFTENQYPMMAQTLPQSQFSPPLLALGDQTAWFQGLVAAISRTIQDDEKTPVVEVIDAKKAEMSTEDEEALIKVLKKWKSGELKMSEVFEELSKKKGHTEAEWKTWFITNFEKLNSKLNLTPNVDHAPEAGTQTSRSGVQRAPISRTRNMVSGSKGQSETRGSKFTSRHRSAPDDATRRPSHHPKSGDFLKTSNRTRVRSRAGMLPAPVTSEDLRAMARHLFENGDRGHDMRRYNSLRWREFAERPENRKRTLAAWACIPRLDPRHAAAIARYLKEYQTEAEAAKSTKVGTSSPGIELADGEATQMGREKDS